MLKKSVEAFITHGVLSLDAVDKINKSGLDKLVITDSIPLRQKSKNIESFVILDDEDVDIIQYYPKNLIKTNYITGLIDEDVEKAIEILNKNV